MKKAQGISREQNAALLEKHYERLIEIIGDNNDYSSARMRFACAIFTITGMRIGELNNLKFKDIETLFNTQKPHVDLRCLKNGPQRTAFLNQGGKGLVLERKADYDLVFKHLDYDPNAYVFSSYKDKKRVNRTYLCKVVQEKLDILSEETQLKFRSHSFRKSYVTQLWKDTGDIEFVRLVIGHKKIETTAVYIEHPSIEEVADLIEAL